MSMTNSSVYGESIDDVLMALENNELGYDDVCAILEAAQKALAVLEDSE